MTCARTARRGDAPNGLITDVHQRNHPAPAHWLYSPRATKMRATFLSSGRAFSSSSATSRHRRSIHSPGIGTGSRT